MNTLDLGERKKVLREMTTGVVDIYKMVHTLMLELQKKKLKCAHIRS